MSGNSKVVNQSARFNEVTIGNLGRTSSKMLGIDLSAKNMSRGHVLMIPEHGFLP